MSAPVPQILDLTAPPVVHKIAQRSLIVGVLFGIGALVLAFTRPNLWELAAATAIAALIAFFVPEI